MVCGCKKKYHRKILTDARKPPTAPSRTTQRSVWASPATCTEGKGGLCTGRGYRWVKHPNSPEKYGKEARNIKSDLSVSRKTSTDFLLCAVTFPITCRLRTLGAEGVVLGAEIDVYKIDSTAIFVFCSCRSC